MFLKVLNILFVSLLLLGFVGCSEKSKDNHEITETHKLVKFEEKIEASGIEHVGGHSYRTNLKLLGSGWEFKENVNYILFENDVQLKGAKKTKEAIEIEGRGRYRVENDKTLVFSSSDNSDPSKNGKKYKVVWEESVVESRLVANLTKSENRIEFTLPEDDQIFTRKIKIINIDADYTVSPSFLGNEVMPMGSLEAILEWLVEDDMTDAEKANALYKFVKKWRYHYYPTEETGKFSDEPHDVVKLFNVYGYGYCDDSALALSAMANAVGLKSRTYCLSGHVVTEIFYNSEWHMYDPDLEVVYKDVDGDIVSASSIERDTSLILDGPELSNGTDRKHISKIYASTNDNYVLATPELVEDLVKNYQKHRIEWEISPGDSVEFLFNGNKALRIDHFDKLLPPIVGNGKVVRKLSSKNSMYSNKTLSMYSNNKLYVKQQWPYTILTGTLSLGNIPVTSKFSASVFDRKDNKYKPLPVKIKKGEVFVDLSRWILRNRSELYEINMVLDGLTPPVKLQDSYLTFDFQFAPKSLPSVSRGENSIQVNLNFPEEDDFPKKWAGLDFSIEWVRQNN